jgi:small redox-active disulfide protein 2
MKVLVLGVGCAKCKRLEENVRALVDRNQLPVQVEKVTDLQEIMKYGIMTTPGLVIDGVVKSAGGIPTDDQLLAWLKGTSS